MAVNTWKIAFHNNRWHRDVDFLCWCALPVGWHCYPSVLVHLSIMHSGWLVPGMSAGEQDFRLTWPQARSFQRPCLSSNKSWGSVLASGYWLQVPITRQADLNWRVRNLISTSYRDAGLEAKGQANTIQLTCCQTLMWTTRIDIKHP